MFLQFVITLMIFFLFFLGNCVLRCAYVTPHARFLVFSFVLSSVPVCIAVPVFIAVPVSVPICIAHLISMFITREKREKQEYEK